MHNYSAPFLVNLSYSLGCLNTDFSFFLGGEGGSQSNTVGLQQEGVVMCCIMQARIQDFLKGVGWGVGVVKHPPPPLGIVRVTSSALQKIEKHTHSWTFTSTPPLDIARVTSSTFQGGGGTGASEQIYLTPRP